MEDVSVPMANIAELINESEKISKENELDIIAFGHAGDGNVHITFLKGERGMEHWNKKLEKALTDLYKLTSKLGGCITGEHGVGLKRKKYLSMTLDVTQIELIKKIKGVFDPNNILNPGKIVDINIDKGKDRNYNE
jgi:glycolate oxidase